MPEVQPSGLGGGLRRTKSYLAYKDSGIEWLGEIPAHWEMKPLKAGIQFVEGPGIMAADFTLEGVPLLRIAGIGGRIATLDGCNFLLPSLVGQRWQHFRVKNGDLLISGSASTGFCTEVDATTEGAVPYTGIIIIRPRPATTKKEYVRWFLLSEAFLVQTKLASSGSTIQHFGPSHLSRMFVPVPPLEEQRSIAAVLDNETAKIDELVAKKERLIELLQEKRTALITRAVTKGLDPNLPMKDSGIEWLDQYPNRWTGLPLKRWVAIKITDGPHETPELVAEGVDFISAEAISNGRVDFEKRRGFISPGLHASYCRKCRPVRNDILVCKSGATTGKLARVNVDFEFSVWSPLAVVRSNPSRIQSRFLEIALGSEYVQRQVQRTWSAGTQPNISMGDLEQLFIVAPYLEEQGRIVAYLDGEVGNFDAVIAKVREAIDRLRELRTALISAAVTGKIDVRGDG